MDHQKRQLLLNSSLAASLLGSATVSSTAMAIGNSTTPSEIEGPFYPRYVQKDQDFDLTRISGKAGEAKGEQVHILGHVHDTDGNALEDVTVDLWQANAAGRYRHPNDTSTAPLDEHFQGWAIGSTSADGAFRIKTIRPGAYAVHESWTRPPHIHFKFSKRGYEELTTQLYFPKQPLNATDRLLQRKSKQEQEAMTAMWLEASLTQLAWIVVLQKV